MPLSAVLVSFRAKQKWTVFFFNFVNLLSKNIFLVLAYLFIIYSLALLCFSSLAEALQVRDVVWPNESSSPSSVVCCFLHM